MSVRCCNCTESVKDHAEGKCLWFPTKFKVAHCIHCEKPVTQAFYEVKMRDTTHFIHGKCAAEVLESMIQRPSDVDSSLTETITKYVQKNLAAELDKSIKIHGAY